jgi:hypothetical protein
MFTSASMRLSKTAIGVRDSSDDASRPAPLACHGRGRANAENFLPTDQVAGPNSSPTRSPAKHRGDTGRGRANGVAARHGHGKEEGDSHVTAIDWGRPGPEPQVEEMVHDPIVQLVMRRDRLTVAQIMATVTRARARLRSDRPTMLPEPNAVPLRTR